MFKVRGRRQRAGPRGRATRSSRSSTQLRKQPHVVSVTTPYDPAGARFISEDGKIAYAEILFDVQANDVPVDLATHMRSIAKDANTDRLQVELGG